jgi:hypothetical protein
MLERVLATLRAAAVTEEGRELLARGRLTEELSTTGFDLAATLIPERGAAPRTSHPRPEGKREQVASARAALSEARQRQGESERRLREADRRAIQARRALDAAEVELDEARAEAAEATSAVKAAEGALERAKRSR